MSIAVKPQIKPRALRPGSMLAIVSPASAAKADLVELGAKHLQALGYRTSIFPSALARGPLYYAGTATERVTDLHAAFAEDAIDGIICTRGGWGSAELLPLLNADVIRAHPKPFIGYSDHTSLQVWLENETGLVTFYGPMVAADFSRLDGVDVASWQHALSGSDHWSAGPAEGLRVLQSGKAEGLLRGGCLALIAEGLGTPYALQPRGGVLFLEDIGVKPYQWDRMLQHMRWAGALDGVQGIVLGDMAQSCAPDEQELLEHAILHALRDFPGPIAIGLRSGHVARQNVTLPLGVRVRLDLTDRENPVMYFLEAAVER